MYKFIKIRHDIIKQCHGNYKEMKRFNYKLEIEIFRNSTQNNLSVLSRVAYRYSGTDRNRYSFRKEQVFTSFVENRY